MRSFLKTVGSFFLLLALLWMGGLLWFITQIPSVPSDNHDHTDAIVVLTGGSQRLDHGLELLAEDRADRMFISGVEDGVSVPSLLRSKEYHVFADRIKPEKITLGHKARSTIGNAIETTQWIAQEHVKSIRLVTGNYHIPRSVYELHTATPETLILPEPVFPGHFSHNEWWHWNDSIRLVLSEYNKYTASVIGHKVLALSW